MFSSIFTCFEILTYGTFQGGILGTNYENLRARARISKDSITYGNEDGH